MATNQQLVKLCMEHFGNWKYVADGISHGSVESRWEMEKPKALKHQLTTFFSEKGYNKLAIPINV